MKAKPKAKTVKKVAPKTLAALLTGKSWFIRTCTYHSVGHVVGVSDGVIRLTEAAWVADSGRFMQAIRDGVLSEVEPVGEMCIMVGAVVDFFPWLHDLPKRQK